MTTTELEQYIFENLPPEHEPRLNHYRSRYGFRNMKLSESFTLMIQLGKSDEYALHVNCYSLEDVKNNFDEWLAEYRRKDCLIQNLDFVACDL